MEILELSQWGVRGPYYMIFKCIKRMRSRHKDEVRLWWWAGRPINFSLEPRKVRWSPFDLLFPGHLEPLRPPSPALISIDTEHPHVGRDLSRACTVCLGLGLDQEIQRRREREVLSRPWVMEHQPQGSPRGGCFVTPQGPPEGKRQWGGPAWPLQRIRMHFTLGFFKTAELRFTRHFKNYYYCCYLLFFFWPCRAACGILSIFPRPESEPTTPLQRNLRVLTTGLPGKSHIYTLSDALFPANNC